MYEVASGFDTLSRPKRFCEPAASSGDARWLSRRARIKRISDRLADAIGPYAEIAVRRAAQDHVSIDQISADVADEIDDPALRRIFLAETFAPGERRHGPGLIFR